MPSKLGSGTALDRLLAARIDLRSAGANYTLPQLARTIKNLDEEIDQAELRYATQLRLGPASEQAQHSSKAPRRNGKRL